MDDILKNSDTTAALNSSNSFVYDTVDLIEPLILTNFQLFYESNHWNTYSDFIILNNSILCYKHDGKYYEEQIINFVKISDEEYTFIIKPDYKFKLIKE